MKVGIDLSSTNTGLVILSDDNKLIFHGNFQLWDNNDRFVMVNKVNDMVDCIRFKRVDNIMNDNDSYFIMVGIELADFKNANITNRFNLLAGMIISELSKLKAPKPICDGLYLHLVDPLKLFNSNEWQQHLGLKPSMERQFRKDTARQFTKSNCLEYQDTWTEDECDAYCIAYFLPQLRDRTQMHQEVKAKKVQAKKSKVQELRDKIKAYDKANKLYEIVNHYKDLANVKKLTKAQQRALEKAEMELKEYGNR